MLCSGFLYFEEAPINCCIISRDAHLRTNNSGERTNPSLSASNGEIAGLAVHITLLGKELRRMNTLNSNQIEKGWIILPKTHYGCNKCGPPPTLRACWAIT